MAREKSLTKLSAEEITGVYVTFDRLDPDTGAGKVCSHEIEALKRVVEVKKVLSRVDLVAEKIYGFNPFLMDYFAAELLPEAEFAHLSCSPGVSILRRVKPKRYVVNIVAHDLKTSIEEHERLYGVGTYPFRHNTDPFLHSLLLRHAEEADVVITPSTGSSAWIEANLKVRKVAVIPHGCDLPEKTPPYPEKFTVGYMGAHGPDKGLIYLLIAWNHLRLDSELVFAGPCCETLKPWIARFCPDGRTRLLGWVKEPMDFFREVSCIVAPSVTEGFGLLTLESMAHGRPPIVSTGAGSSDLVNKRCGIKVAPRRPDQIAEAILEMRDKYEKLGREARRKASDYRWSLIEDRYEELYRSLLE